jgi:hypothetical protein
MSHLFRFLLVLSLSVPNAFANDKADAYRIQIREWVRSHAARIPVIEPAENDLAENLVDELAYKNLAEMEQKGLLKAELPNSPWADSYWPTYAGQIANRYNDPNYNAALVWKYNFDYLTENLGQGGLEHMSPAEKYDLLVGDSAFTLTSKMIRAGLPFADAEGKVETWFGLCHGWSPASFMLPRPAHAVSVKAADGRTLTFTPSDMKALATLLWANGAGPTKFIGARCNDKKPPKDGNGRDTNPDCFDTNPATWHLSVVNQIGVSKRSFVIDASAGYEVWNQPVFGYQYGYVNPNTNKSSYTLADMKVRLSDLKNDVYAAHRSAKAEYVVNVIMSLSYVTENGPSTLLTDSSENDAYQAATYTYDLELDRDDNIVGGEWHSGLHPDFLWVPVKGSKASSSGDAWLKSRGDNSTWDGSAAIPPSWQKAAKMAANHEQPLARVVEQLLELSRR